MEVIVEGHQTIHKAMLKPTPGLPQRITMPLGAQVLECQWQDGGIAVWYSFRTDVRAKGIMFMDFKVAFTGQEILLPGYRHLNTIQNGGLVYHVFVWPGEENKR